ncbi:MAG: hypothetical protein WAJ88_20070 [Pseudolabrys sp.]
MDAKSSIDLNTDSRPIIGSRLFDATMARLVDYVATLAIEKTA